MRRRAHGETALDIERWLALAVNVTLTNQTGFCFLQLRLHYQRNSITITFTLLLPNQTPP